MANATITTIKPVKPDQKVTLELSIKEAAVFQCIVGNVSGTGTFREITDELFRALQSIERVHAYHLQIHRATSLSTSNSFPVGHFDIPEEA